MMSEAMMEAQTNGNAPADSLLGQLQRGRGAGFLRALREDASVVRPLLLDCLLHDPRWDRQVETRADYYAALIAHSALPLDPLDAHLRAAETDAHTLFDRVRNANSLALTTLRALSARGYAPAIPIMRAYLDYGESWDEAFEALMEGARDMVSVDRISGVIDRRFPDDDTLDAMLPSPGPGMHTLREPWRSLRAVNPRVDRVLSAHERDEEQRERRQEQARLVLAGLSAPELFAGVDAGNYYVTAMALQERVTSGEFDLLLDVAQHGDRWQRFVAYRGLERLAHPASFPVLRAFLESSQDEPVVVYNSASRAIVALPSALTLDLARTWFGFASSDRRHHVARRILETHATVDDVPLARAALRSSLRAGSAQWRDYYLMCDMLEILARFPEASPYPEAEAVFEDVKYAYARIYAAEALDAGDRDRFARGLALECLWDCESRVREIGCDSVDLAVPGAWARLHELARDPHEDEGVRDAAKERITYAERS